MANSTLLTGVLLSFFVSFSAGSANADEALATASPAPAATATPKPLEKEPAFLAKVFDSDSNKQQLLFTYRQTSKSEGDLHILTNTYYDPQENVVAIENTTLQVGAGGVETLKAYRMDQKQLKTIGLIEIKDGKADFTFTRDGKTKTNDEKAVEEFIVGPTITLYLQKHWAQVAAGDHLKVRFAVPDRVETVGFELFKQEEELIDNKPVWTIKMKPSSFLIAALVRPFFFFYTPDAQHLVEVHGRTQVKRNVDGKFKDLDAVTTFDYSAAAVGNSK